MFPREARKDQCSILSDGESVLNARVNERPRLIVSESVLNVE